ncbi:hypothetical protein DB43_HD00250 [Parachlamydia acanthamoebae]|nr:hypothetical protein DB43_HD00250 [Parachlamydia acanthamoebae]
MAEDPYRSMDPLKQIVKAEEELKKLKEEQDSYEREQKRIEDIQEKIKKFQSELENYVEDGEAQSNVSPLAQKLNEELVHDEQIIQSLTAQGKFDEAKQVEKHQKKLLEEELKLLSSAPVSEKTPFFEESIQQHHEKNIDDFINLALLAQRENDKGTEQVNALLAQLAILKKTNGQPTKSEEDRIKAELNQIIRAQSQSTSQTYPGVMLEEDENALVEDIVIQAQQLSEGMNAAYKDVERLLFLCKSSSVPSEKDVRRGAGYFSSFLKTKKAAKDPNAVLKLAVYTKDHVVFVEAMQVVAQLAEGVRLKAYREALISSVKSCYSPFFEKLLQEVTIDDPLLAKIWDAVLSGKSIDIGSYLLKNYGDESKRYFLPLYEKFLNDKDWLELVILMIEKDPELFFKKTQDERPYDIALKRGELEIIGIVMKMDSVKAYLSRI